MLDLCSYPLLVVSMCCYIYMLKYVLAFWRLFFWKILNCFVYVLNGRFFIFPLEWRHLQFEWVSGIWHLGPYSILFVCSAYTTPLGPAFKTIDPAVLVPDKVRQACLDIMDRFWIWRWTSLNRVLVNATTVWFGASNEETPLEVGSSRKFSLQIHKWNFVYH